jgi:hypothetical protein
VAPSYCSFSYFADLLILVFQLETSDGAMAVLVMSIILLIYGFKCWQLVSTLLEHYQVSIYKNVKMQVQIK